VTHAHINALAARVPRYEVHSLFDGFARRLITDRRRALVERMLKRSGVERRYSVLEPLGAHENEHALDAEGNFTFGAFPSTATRMRLYDREAAALAADTVRDLADVPLEETTHLVVCSCTGFAAPGVDLQLLQRLGLPLTVQRTIVGFMGCYAGISALRLARSIVRSEPDAKVLVVAVELCTLHLQETSDIEVVLSFSVFGDGCAAAFVTAEPGGLRLDGFGTAVMPAAQDLITWHVGDVGFDMRLSGEVPGALADALPGAVDALVPAGADAVDLWAIHPGGRSVLDAAERALHLPAAALCPSRTVLRDYGNMSSPSILFVLAEMMRRGPSPGTRGLAMAFGPGLTAEGMRFSAAAP
jgi:predicted naringenin-chalcone synthase